jgi:Universal stress protein family
LEFLPGPHWFFLDFSVTGFTEASGDEDHLVTCAGSWKSPPYSFHPGCKEWRHDNPANQHKRIALNNILFLTDFSEPSAAAVPFATSIARAYGSTVHALHVLVPSPCTYMTPEAVPILLDDDEDRARAEMQRVEAEFSGVPGEFMIERGPRGVASSFGSPKATRNRLDHPGDARKDGCPKAVARLVRRRSLSTGAHSRAHHGTICVGWQS